MRQARPSQPCQVHHLDSSFFRNYESLQGFNSKRPGQKAGDATVTDIRGLLYDNGMVKYKLLSVLPQRRAGTRSML